MCVGGCVCVDSIGSGKGCLNSCMTVGMTSLLRSVLVPAKRHCAVRIMAPSCLEQEFYAST